MQMDKNSVTEYVNFWTKGYYINYIVLATIIIFCLKIVDKTNTHKLYSVFGYTILGVLTIVTYLGIKQLKKLNKVEINEKDWGISSVFSFF